MFVVVVVVDVVVVTVGVVVDVVDVVVEIAHSCSAVTACFRRSSNSAGKVLALYHLLRQWLCYVVDYVAFNNDRTHAVQTHL
jgi:hypothetical protein